MCCNICKTESERLHLQSVWFIEGDKESGVVDDESCHHIQYVACYRSANSKIQLQ